MPRAKKTVAKKDEESDVLTVVNLPEAPDYVETEDDLPENKVVSKFDGLTLDEIHRAAAHNRKLVPLGNDGTVATAGTDGPIEGYFASKD